jgi:hypothetical protein
MTRRQRTTGSPARSQGQKKWPVQQLSLPEGHQSRPLATARAPSTTQLEHLSACNCRAAAEPAERRRARQCQSPAQAGRLGPGARSRSYRARCCEQASVDHPATPRCPARPGRTRTNRTTTIRPRTRPRLGPCGRGELIVAFPGAEHGRWSVIIAHSQQPTGSPILNKSKFPQMRGLPISASARGIYNKRVSCPLLRNPASSAARQHNVAY